jgi:hypothetical protein
VRSRCSRLLPCLLGVFSCTLHITYEHTPSVKHFCAQSGLSSLPLVHSLRPFLEWSAAPLDRCSHFGLRCELARILASFAETTSKHPKNYQAANTFIVLSPSIFNCGFLLPRRSSSRFHPVQFLLLTWFHDTICAVISDAPLPRPLPHFRDVKEGKATLAMITRW